MNFLDTESSSIRRQYVVDTMRKNSFSSIAAVPKQNLFSKVLQHCNKKNVFFSLIVIFTVADILVSILSNSQSFIVNANRLTSAEQNGLVLGESTALSPSPVTVLSRKSAVPGYEIGDSRILALKKYLEQKGSPMSSFADVFVTEADKVGMDWTLVAGIAGAESNFGRVTTLRMDNNSQNSYNFAGWNKGWQGNSKRFQEFSSWTDSISTITRGIAKGYGNNPKPAEMQNVYCTSCALTGTNKWSQQVKGNMEDIKSIEKNI